MPAWRSYRTRPDETRSHGHHFAAHISSHAGSKRPGAGGDVALDLAMTTPAERLREALSKIVESCKHESGYTKVDTIRELAEAALAASGHSLPPVVEPCAGHGSSATARELSFNEFSRVNRQRCESKDGFNHALQSWSTSDWFLALLGELGEAANIAKKLNRVRDGIPGNKQSKEELQDKLRQELGDSFVYLDLLSQSLGISIGEAAVEVFNAKSKELGCPIAVAGNEPSSRGLPRRCQERNAETGQCELRLGHEKHLAGYLMWAASGTVDAAAYPRPCGLCSKNIESEADLDWHGLGNCVDICARCHGSGQEPEFITPAEQAELAKLEAKGVKWIQSQPSPTVPEGEIPLIHGRAELDLHDENLRAKFAAECERFHNEGHKCATCGRQPAAPSGGDLREALQAILLIEKWRLRSRGDIQQEIFQAVCEELKPVKAILTALAPEYKTGAVTEAERGTK